MRTKPGTIYSTAGLFSLGQGAGRVGGTWVSSSRICCLLLSSSSSWIFETPPDLLNQSLSVRSILASPLVVAVDGNPTWSSLDERQVDGETQAVSKVGAKDRPHLLTSKSFQNFLSLLCDSWNVSFIFFWLQTDFCVRAIWQPTSVNSSWSFLGLSKD